RPRRLPCWRCRAPRNRLANQLLATPQQTANATGLGAQILTGWLTSFGSGLFRQPEPSHHVPKPRIAAQRIVGRKSDGALEFGVLLGIRLLQLFERFFSLPR